MGLRAIKDAIEVEKRRAYSLKTKKAQFKAWDKVRELEREALNILYTQRDLYARHSIKGTVVRDTYDTDEEVIVSTPFGNFWIPLTCDEQSKSWYPGTCCIEYSKGQEVIIEFDVDVDEGRLTICRYPKLVHGGHVNESKYAELCKRTDLAFFKYPDGHRSGLLS